MPRPIEALRVFRRRATGHPLPKGEGLEFGHFLLNSLAEANPQGW